MRITANQVTLLRLLALPVPVAMVYQGSQTWLLAALVVYTLLGLTDAVDGMLARRHGATPLGALLDPVVDKIFLVASYGPLADLGIVPLVGVVVLFVRELGVTLLRSIALEEQFHFRTSRIAKLKTTVQMGGAGFILLMWLFPADSTIRLILGAGLVVASVPALVALAGGRRPGWKGTWAVILLLFLLGIRSILAPRPAILGVMTVVVGFTVVSGAEYAWGMRHVLLGRFRRMPLEALRLALLSTTIPLVYLPALAHFGAPCFAILSVLAAELAAGGLDNSLVQAGAGRGTWPDLVRAGSQALLGTLVLWAMGTAADPPLVHVPAWIALAVTLVDVVVRGHRHSAAFRTA